MHKKIAAVGLAALLTVGTGTHAFAQQQQHRIRYAGAELAADEPESERQ